MFLWRRTLAITQFSRSRKVHAVVLIRPFLATRRPHIIRPWEMIFVRSTTWVWVDVCAGGTHRNRSRSGPEPKSRPEESANFFTPELHGRVLFDRGLDYRYALMSDLQ